MSTTVNAEHAELATTSASARWLPPRANECSFAAFARFAFDGFDRSVTVKDAGDSIPTAGYP
jgi:hypothetical protein